MSQASEIDNIPEGILLGMGNPLLDITVKADHALLEKYGLNANDAIEADSSHQPLFDELLNYNPAFIAGGANQNTIRTAQWMLQKPGATTYFGCIGKDHWGEEMKNKAQEVGVHVRYQVDSEVSTGVCGAIITGEDRSLVARPGAALHFTCDFLQQPENWAFVEKAKFYYLCGFPFTVTPQSIMKIANHSCEQHKTLVMNLSAPFLCKYYADPEYDIMQCIDVLFGNETEAAVFCKLKGISATSIQQMALETSLLPMKDARKKRVVIFTQGRDPTIIAHDGVVEEHAVVPVDHNLIKDTNGAGDAFVGGFLSQLVQGKPLGECLRCARYTARIVVQQWGCTHPPNPDFNNSQK